jgi:hydroxyacylglutathione hydrolase
MPGVAVVTAIVDEGLGNASYVVDIGGGHAIAVDPPRDVRSVLAAAGERELRIAWVIDTHLHNDFVSGNLELARLGATLVMPRAAAATFDHVGVGDGDEVDVGAFVLRAIGTPGHTPEHVSYLLLERGVPVALFSGGALLRRSVARTDLLGPDVAGRLARELYASLHDRLLTLPDDVAVHPTHGAGATFCAVGATGDGEVATTIGEERRLNPLLHVLGPDRFAEEILRDPAPFPTYFAKLRNVNQHERRVFGTETTLPTLSPDQVIAAETHGAVILDVRDVRSFAAGHIPGALSIELRPAFATWLGWLVEHDRPLVFVIDEGQDRADLAWQCRKIGFDRLRGELDGAMGRWIDEGRPTRSLETLDRDTDVDDAVFVDVRHAAEYRSGHLPGATSAPLGDLAASLPALPSSPLVVYCGHGQRATTAASVLERGGRADVRVLLGSLEDRLPGSQPPDQ